MTAKSLSIFFVTTARLTSMKLKAMTTGWDATSSQVALCQVLIFLKEYKVNGINYQETYGAENGL